MDSPAYYVNNKELLIEIHKSKSSYTEFTDPSNTSYDMIIFPPNFKLPLTEEHSLEYLKAQCLLPETIQQAKENKAYKWNSVNKLKKADKISADSIDENGLIFRVLSYDHIPDDTTGRKKTPKFAGDRKIKVNFVPFLHFELQNGELIQTATSHRKDGEFSCTHGNITSKLAEMFMMIVDRYSQKFNWRRYTYLNEMKGQSLLHLVYMGLSFNEHKSDNPFAYYTQSITNSFVRVLNEEKEHQDLRDDLMEEYGQNPSMTRQLENDEEVRRARDSH